MCLCERTCEWACTCIVAHSVTPPNLLTQALGHTYPLESSALFTVPEGWCLACWQFAFCCSMKPTVLKMGKGAVSGTISTLSTTPPALLPGSDYPHLERQAPLLQSIFESGIYVLKGRVFCFILFYFFRQDWERFLEPSLFLLCSEMPVLFGPPSYA